MKYWVLAVLGRSCRKIWSSSSASWSFMALVSSAPLRAHIRESSSVMESGRCSWQKVSERRNFTQMAGRLMPSSSNMGYGCSRRMSRSRNTSIPSTCRCSVSPHSVLCGSSSEGGRGLSPPVAAPARAPCGSGQRRGRCLEPAESAVSYPHSDPAASY